MWHRSFLVLAALAAAVGPLGGTGDAAAASDGGRAEAVRIALEPVADGLSSPVFITNARDGSGRLFIVEQTGRIRILCGCTPELRVFLDVSSKIVSGGEQGLLGLAFHPLFRQNRRFFVNYTRRSDGATVVSEFRASETDRSAADPAETVLLTVSQPFSNHNGGMIEFGPDGYLYIGMGDGGSGNDPGNRAQNPAELLGKMLRIDVDRAGTGTAYAIPADNPFVGSPGTRPEIFALGLRNPWRFSFDRATGLLYAGDVGQGQVEEVSVIRRGGNYGWRVVEGNRCTGLGPSACDTPGFAPPVVTYTHSQGRCSITGGYVYRGRRGSLPLGSYIYGDYCTGEIFMFSGGTPVLLADTGLGLSSFGEDENGEFYVAGIGGTVHRIVNPEAPAPVTAYFPYLRTSIGQPGSPDESTGLAVTNLDVNKVSLTLRAFGADGTLLQGAEVTNPRVLELEAGAQLAMLDSQLFGPGYSSVMRDGWLTLEGSARRIVSFFLTFDPALSFIDGAPAGPDTMTRFVLPDPGTGPATRIRIANPGPDPAGLSAELIDGNGGAKAAASRTVAGRGLFAGSLEELFPGSAVEGSDYVRVTSTHGVVPATIVVEPGRSARALNGIDASAGGVVLHSPQYAVGGGYRSVLNVVNLDTDPGEATFRLYGDDGTLIGGPRTLSIGGRGKIAVSDPRFFGDFSGALTQGYVEVRSDGIRLAGNITYGDDAGRAFSASLPLATGTATRMVFGQIASDATYYTGLALLNAGAAATTVLIEVLDGTGAGLGSVTVGLPAHNRSSRLLTQLLPGLIGRQIGSGSIRVTAEPGIAAFAVFGTNRLDSLSAIAGLWSPE
jgi:glucose/arabinose dehydrogenase